ncbi:phosphatidylserine decarboxylase [Desulfogranum marinum]|uniref:phosphatidylserine decarboxylase n=1 Tax=Desulfogranum marinum TaxID=453220 RepID=UPI0029C94330|nr:phosphatidylserine decarboxylase [Desulfogranum marinum]
MPKCIIILLSVYLLAGCATLPKNNAIHREQQTPSNYHTSNQPKISPCSASLQYLQFQYDTDPATRKAFDKVYAGLTDLPAGYRYKGSAANPWKAADSGRGMHQMMVKMFQQWCTTLPEIKGGADNALDPILYFAWAYYQNPAGQDFVQGRDPLSQDNTLETGPTFLSKWNEEYLNYMNSKESAKLVHEWVKDPRIEIDDYRKTTAADYASWNDFFARNLKSDQNDSYPSRPVTMPGRDYVVVSPTDCIMNPLVQQVEKSPHTYERRYIENPLQLDTVLDVKNIPISINDILGTVPEDIKEQFVGGSGLTCVLMPNTYHHFHSPVDGTVIHAEVVKTGTPGTPSTFGYPDFPNWVPSDGNVGRPGTDFSQFQAFQRGVIVIKMEYENLPGETPEKKTGYLASIPVGLNSVGSVVLNTCDSEHTDHVNCFDVGGKVQKGKTKLGNFFFGGSLNILLFSKEMISPAVQTRMGNQIGVINIGAAPKSPWSLD